MGQLTRVCSLFHRSAVERGPKVERIEHAGYLRRGRTQGAWVSKTRTRDYATHSPTFTLSCAVIRFPFSHPYGFALWWPIFVRVPIRFPFVLAPCALRLVFAVCVNTRMVHGLACAFHSRCMFHRPLNVRYSFARYVGRVSNTLTGSSLCVLLDTRAIACYDGRMVAIYQVEVLEHDSSPWDDGHLFSKQGAWNRVRALARLVVDGWPHPIWARIYLMKGEHKTLVYSCDLSQWASSHRD